MRNKFIFLSIVIISLFGCKKDDSKPSNTPTKTTLLTQQSWKFDNAKAGGNLTTNVGINGAIFIGIETGIVKGPGLLCEKCCFRRGWCRIRIIFFATEKS